MVTLLGLAPQAAAADGEWYVDQDHGSTAVDCGLTPDTACVTIGQALEHAGNGDTIHIAASDDNYEGGLTIDKSVTLRGDGNGVNVQGTASVPQQAIILITGGAEVSLANLGVVGGDGTSAVVVDNASTVTLTNTSLGSSAASEGARGSGLVIMGGSSASLVDSTVVGVAHGVSVPNGTVVVINTTIADNQAGLAVDEGTVTITGSQITTNEIAGVVLGGHDPDVDISNSEIVGNGADIRNRVFGGGILKLSAGGDLTVSNTVIRDNDAGITAFGGRVTVTDSVVSSNGFGLVPRFPWDGAGIAAVGMNGTSEPQFSVRRTEISDNTYGVSVSAAAADIIASTIANNQMAGIMAVRIGNLTKAALTKLPKELVTVSDRSRIDELRPVDDVTPLPLGTVVATASTIVGNGGQSLPDDQTFGNLAIGDGSTLVLGGSIVAGPEPACTDGGKLGGQGIVHDGGHNLVADGSCDLTLPTSVQSVDPELGDLTGNGGAGRTMLPTAGSPAVDLIPAGAELDVPDGLTPGSLCAAGSTDQRGTARPQGDACEAGAAEVETTAPVVITTESLADATEDVEYSESLTATGGNGSDYRWSMMPGAGSLPDGLELDPATGIIAGTPTTSGTFTFTVSVNGEVAKDFTIAVRTAPVPSPSPSETETSATPTPPPSSPSPTEAGSSSTPPAPTESTGPATPGPGLADTGANGQLMPALVGILALIAGAGVMLTAARSRIDGRYRG